MQQSVLTSDCVASNAITLIFVYTIKSLFIQYHSVTVRPAGSHQVLNGTLTSVSFSHFLSWTFDSEGHGNFDYPASIAS